MATTTSSTDGRVPDPARPRDDYTREAAEARRAFADERTGASLEHVSSYSFDPRSAGQRRALHRRRAGPDRPRRPAAGQRRARAGRVLRAARDRRGHARGELQPRHAPAPRGGRRDDDDPRRPHAARARVPVPERPRGARVRRLARPSTSTRSSAAAETTTRSGKLQDIEQYSASRMLYTRFDYTTGDAAGQNLTGKATPAACEWIASQLPGHRAVLPRVELRDRQEELPGQHAAHARQARGRRGDAPERAVPEHHALEHRACTGRARSPTSAASCRASTTTAPTRPTASRRCSSRPGRTPPTSRSPRPPSSTPSCANGDYYYSVTIPSLIVATYGGGTGPRDPARMPRAARLLRHGQGAQVRRDRRGDRALRRALARLGDRRRGVGEGPRPARAQPALARVRARVRLEELHRARRRSSLGSRCPARRKPRTWWSTRSTARRCGPRVPQPRAGGRRARAGGGGRTGLERTGREGSVHRRDQAPP